MYITGPQASHTCTPIEVPQPHPALAGYVLARMDLAGQDAQPGHPTDLLDSLWLVY